MIRVIAKKEDNILIEVKYRDAAPISDKDAISELCNEASAAVIVTKSPEDFGVHNTKSGTNMLRIPAYAFLYLLGHAEKNGYKGIEQPFCFDNNSDNNQGRKRQDQMIKADKQKAVKKRMTSGFSALLQQMCNLPDENF